MDTSDDMPFIRELCHPLPIAICKAIGVDVSTIESMTIRFAKHELCMVHISKVVKPGELNDITDKYIFAANKINNGDNDGGD